MVFNISKPIDVVSPADGKRYTSVREYDKAHHARGQDVMTDKSYRELREKLIDTSKSSPKSAPESYNHVHIDFSNGRVIKSKKDLNT